MTGCIRPIEIKGPELPGNFQEPAMSMPMNRNFLLALIGALAVFALGAGYLYYQESRSSIEIEIDSQGLRIDGN